MTTVNLRGVSGRFWKRVDRNGPARNPAIGPCWTWTGAIGGGGYGRIRKRNGPAVYAHRFSWELHNGPVPAGLKVLHRCDNPPCVRPAHLFLGTSLENSRDMVDKGRARHGPVVGAQNPRARLRESDVLAIRASSRPNAEEARARGVSAALVGAIRRREVWDHLPGPIAPARDGRKGRSNGRQSREALVKIAKQ